MSKKLDNTRIVTFNEDYKIKGGKIVYAKGSEHAIHFKTVEALKKSGAKMDVKEHREYKKEKKSGNTKAKK